MDFVSVERVVELLHLEQEPPGSIDPPARWPSYNGDIVFEDVTLRYAPHLDPSLTGISFRIPAGSTTALLGRTGRLSLASTLNSQRSIAKTLVQVPAKARWHCLFLRSVSLGSPKQLSDNHITKPSQ